MKPTDNKSLLNFIFEQMSKLDNNEIDCDQASAQAKLAKEANNSLLYEIKRAELIMKMKHAGIDIKDIEDEKAIEKAGTKIKLPLHGSPYEVIEEINKESE